MLQSFLDKEDDESDGDDVRSMISGLEVMTNDANWVNLKFSGFVYYLG